MEIRFLFAPSFDIRKDICTFVPLKFLTTLLIMYKFHSFSCRFTPVQLHLGGSCCLRGKEVLANLFGEDFRNPEWTFLADPKLNVHYHHEYVETRIKDVYIMRVANKRVYEQPLDLIHSKPKVCFPYLYIIIDLRQDLPVFMIEDYSEVPSSAKEVVSVLENTINREAGWQGWNVKFNRKEKELTPTPQCLCQVMESLKELPRTIEELKGVDNMCRTYQKESYRAAPPAFYSFVTRREKADVIYTKLLTLMDGKAHAKDVLRPVRAAIDLGLIRRPTFREFLESFHLSVSFVKASYSMYTNPNTDAYFQDEIYNKIKEELAEIV